MKWLYKKNFTNTVRYVLGEFDNKSDSTLICLGINPSTAIPNNLDNTLMRVRSIAATKPYSNWIMLNIYPQRSKTPDNLHNNLNQSIHKKNLRHIKKILKKFTNADILFAYGDSIEKRYYLRDCLNDIKTTIKKFWHGTSYCISLTQKNNPIHPLYQSANSTFLNYPI